MEMTSETNVSRIKTNNIDLRVYIFNLQKNK